MRKSLRSSARLACLLLAMLTASGALGARLFWLQIVASNRFDELAADQRERMLVLPAQRGSILARDGSELAISMDMQTIYASPRSIRDPAAAAAAIAPILGLHEGRLRAQLSKRSGFVYVARRVDPALAGRVAELKIPGVAALSESKRFYPSGELAAQVVGFVGSDNGGLSGLESRYDRVLNGSPGKMVMERDPTGRRIPSGKSYVKQPIPGDDLVLTLEKDIQFEAEAALKRAMKAWGAAGGSIIVMNPESGSILAMANAPTFNPNNIKGSSAQSRKNRAAVDVFEFGSVNKLVTAAAALESGVIRPSDLMSLPDRLKIGAKVFKDAHPHPTQTLSFSQVIQRSSNIGMIRVAERLGKQRLYDYLRRFGYGSYTGLGFPGESPGIVPRPENWWGTSLGAIAIGQAFSITPLQLVKAYATVANDGVEVEPSLVAATVDGSGKRRPAEPAGTRRVISEDTARELKQILVGVTEDKNGTGTAAAIPGYRVGGKTGTAQRPRQGVPGYSGYTSSFVGFAPAEDPKLVVGVVLDDPAPFLAGATAAVTFKEVMQFSLRRLGIEPAPRVNPTGTALAAPAGR
ncbi:MAG: penicillin-binding protein 2 [Actinomycetota bacterium]|nr:penicillin-binding protein 2 [Actinomycetota bacterium]